MVGKRRHTARNRPASAPLPIDLRRFAAKHADVALGANLASKDFVQIAVATMRIGMCNKNNGLQGRKSGSSIPLNVLGGYRWPNAVGVNGGLLRKITR